MKLKKILLGAILLCNCQLANSAGAASRMKVSSPSSTSDLFLAKARLALGEETSPAAHSLAPVGDAGSLLFLAQITPDNTLGNESSTVVPDAEVQGVPADLIEGGAERGANLFHSFEEFNIGDGQNVYFANPEGIANIFSRVTGNDVSDIMGILGVDGGADLFLINPNGIVFGENASLDVNGSFLASTADSILFGNDEFSASDPGDPPLLTVNMPVGLNLGNNPGSIVNRSTASNGESNPTGLSVSTGNNLSFIGGDIQFEGGKATAKGGKIELGGLSAAGRVSISEDDSLTFPEDVARADIALNNGATVSVRGTGGGNIAINARNFDLTTSTSTLEAGIIANSTSNNSQAGDITINLSDKITIDAGIINNIVGQDAVGNAGDVNISTGSIEVTNRGFISAAINGRGEGNAGNININARENVTLNDSTGDTFVSNITSRVDPEAVGDAGNITINTTNLSIAGGGIDVITLGRGNAGDINIVATGEINIDSKGFSNGILSQVDPGAVGNAGSVNISTSSLTLSNGGQISAGTLGVGDGGDIIINAREDISFESSSTIANEVNTRAIGNAGDIKIETGNLNFTERGFISAGTKGRGDGGDIIINAREDIVLDDLTSDTFTSNITSRVQPGGAGDAGDIAINTNNLILTGGGIDVDTSGAGNAGKIDITATGEISIDSKGFNNGILSTVNPGAVGNAGSVNIFTSNLTIKDGGRINASTSGQGNAGNVEIAATDISIDGENANNNITFIGSRVEPRAVGNARGIKISTDNLTITNGGFLDASTFGQGNAGSIDVTAEDITFDGINLQGTSSSIFSQVNPGGEGNAGGVKIDTDNLNLINGGQISASTFGLGNAGSVEINTDNLNLINGGQIITSTFGLGNAGNVEIATVDITVEGFGSNVTSTAEREAVGNAGNINIEADSLSLDDRANINTVTRSQTSNSNGAANITLQIAESITLKNNSSISARAFENASGGNITINNDNGYILAIPNQNNDIVANAEQGQGGNIFIEAKSIFGIEERPLNDSTNDINASSEFDSSGTVDIDILQTDPSQDALDLTVIPVQTEVARTCNLDSDLNGLVVTGRGGVPNSAEANLEGGFTLEDWRIDEASSESIGRSLPTKSAPNIETTKPIVEADSWQLNQQGKVVLVAANSHGQSSDITPLTADCTAN